MIYLTIRLTLEHPVIGVPLLAVVILAYVHSRKTERFASSTVSWRRRPPAARRQLTRLRELDPNFSLPLFLDFLRLLYVRLQEARGHGDSEALRPYVAAPVLAGQDTPGLRGVKEVIVGSATILHFRSGGGRTHLQVKIEANLARPNCSSHEAISVIGRPPLLLQFSRATFPTGVLFRMGANVSCGSIATKPASASARPL